MQDEFVKARADAEQLQREEERLGALADVLENEVVSREWQVPLLEKGVDDTERTHAIFLREATDFEGLTDRHLTLITSLRNQEAGLRQDSVHKRREVERIMEQVGQYCVSGIDLRMLGNLAQANSILRRVEKLVYEADRLEEESRAHIRQIESNNEGIQYLVSHIGILTDFRGELLQGVVDLQNRLISLRSKIQEK